MPWQDPFCLAQSNMEKELEGIVHWLHRYYTSRKVFLVKLIASSVVCAYWKLSQAFLAIRNYRCKFSSLFPINLAFLQ